MGIIYKDSPFYNFPKEYLYLRQDQIKKCAEVGTESLAKTDITQFNETDKKFVARNPGNTINNILNGSQNPTNGQVLGG